MAKARDAFLPLSISTPAVQTSAPQAREQPQRAQGTQRGRVNPLRSLCSLWFSTAVLASAVQGPSVLIRGPSGIAQCEWGRPLAQAQHPPPPSVPTPQAEASLSPELLEAKVENFFSNRVEPQRGQRVPFQLLERTNTSLSLSHFAQ